MSDTPVAAPAAPAAAPGRTRPTASEKRSKDAKASEAEPPKNMTAAEKKIWKLKAAGKEIDFDASDEERVKRAIEKGLGADEVFQTAAQTRKQAERFLHLLRTDPKSILTNPNLGIDIKKVAEEIVWDAIQEQSLTPEQKKPARHAARARKIQGKRRSARKKSPSSGRRLSFIRSIRPTTTSGSPRR
jgi:hypothetical protein